MNRFHILISNSTTQPLNYLTISVLTDMLNYYSFKGNPRLGMKYLEGEFCQKADEKERVKNNLKKAEGMLLDMGMDYWPARTQEFLDRL